MPDLTDLCVECTQQLAAFQTGLLPEAERAVLDEHMAGCPNCRLFQDQIEETVGFVETLPLRDTAAQLAAALAGVAGSASRSDDAGMVLEQLCRLADSLGPSRAEDLVQRTFLAGLERDPGRLELAELAQYLVDSALAHDTSADPDLGSRTLDDVDWGQQRSGFDPDADSAELFYPDFYESGPELGQFIGSPNIWGETNTLTPEEDVDTGELYITVEAALDQLPVPLGQLVQLVDIERVPLAEAASVLRLGADDAADGLNRARIHLRGAINASLA